MLTDVAGPYRIRGHFLPTETVREAWIVDGRLSFTPVSDADLISDGGWILPGLIDAHCHVGLSPSGHVGSAEGLAEQAITDRDTGALLLRDAGSPVDNRTVQRRDDLPRLIRAGRHIARTRRYIRDLGVEVEPDDLVAEIETQAAAGDGWVKIAADWIDRSTGDLAPTFPDDAVAAAITRAHELGVRVAAHVFGEQALPALIAAGIDSIEHGCGLTADQLDEVARRGIAVVPTLINIDTFPEIAAQAEEKFPVYAAHMRSLLATSRERIQAAWAAGIPIYTGTDAGGSLPHGLLFQEISALVGAGIPLAEVVAQASWRGRAWLGLSGLTEGAEADLVIYDEDPRAVLSTLAQPRRIVLRGAVVA